MAGTTRSASQSLQTLRDDGVLTLPHTIGTDEIAEIRGHFWSEVEQQFAVREDDVDTWFANPHNPAGDARARRLSGMNPVMQRLGANGTLRGAEDAIQTELDAIFGPNRWGPLDKWYSLVSFPGTEGSWTVPSTSWHNDEPIVMADHEPWSLFAFLFLDRVDRDTGPTLAVTGTHRRGQMLAAQRGVQNERDVRAFADVNSEIVSDPGALRILRVGTLLPELAATDDWFGDLVAEESTDDREQRFMQSGTSHQGIQSRVVDLSADAGDVIIFDPRCLHTFSANISNRPRQVLRLDFQRLAP